MRKETKRGVGRPTKKPERGKRISLGLKVTAETKRRIDLGARASGRTQSQEAEHRIELPYHLERAQQNFDSFVSDLGMRLANNLTLAASGQLELQKPGIDPKFSALVADAVKGLSKSPETKSPQQKQKKGGNK